MESSSRLSGLDAVAVAAGLFSVPVTLHHRHGVRVQETLLMRLVPDNLRGRVITTDRASEILVMSISTVFAAWSCTR